MKVLVTGAGGHLGYNLVAMLLADGRHQVRASLRSTTDQSAVARLQALGPVEVVAAPLENAGALGSAMQGVDALIHAAAIYLLHAPGRDEEIVGASVDGVEMAFRAAASAGVRRIVLTSSIVSLPMTLPGAPSVTEADWATDLRVPYFRGKTLAEKRAWELSKELALDLITILPGAFAGPGFARNTPSVDLVQSIMKGAMDIAAPPVRYPYVDVRDVARAHILALESTASGRFIAINEPIPTLAEIAVAMHAVDPAIPKPRFTLPGFVMPVLPFLEVLNSRLTGAPRTMTPEMAATMRGKVFNISSARIRRELGWAPAISLRQSLADTIAELRGNARKAPARIPA